MVSRRRSSETQVSERNPTAIEDLRCPFGKIDKPPGKPTGNQGLLLVSQTNCPSRGPKRKLIFQVHRCLEARWEEGSVIFVGLFWVAIGHSECFCWFPFSHQTGVHHFENLQGKLI